VEGCRYPMNWKKAERKETINEFTYHQKLIQLQLHSECLQDGGFQILSDDNYVFAYARFVEDEIIFVVLSMDDETREVELPIENYGFRDWNINCDYFEHPIEFKNDGGIVKVMVPPHENYLIQLHK